MLSHIARHAAARVWITVALMFASASIAAGQAQFERLTPVPPPKADGVGITPANFALIRDQLLRETWGQRTEGRDEWPMVVDLINLHSPIADELSRAPEPGGPRTAIDCAMIYDAPSAPEGDEAAIAARALAREAIARCEKAGVFAAQAALRERFNIRWPDGSGALQDWNLTVTGNLWPMARMNAARMKLAADAKDWPAVIAAYQDQLVLARISSTNPIIINQLVSYAIAALANKELREHLISGPPDAATLRRLITIIDDQRPFPGVIHAIHAEKAFAVDTIEATHGWWGRRREVRKYEELYDGVAKLAAAPRWERTPKVFDIDGFSKARLKTPADQPDMATTALAWLRVYDQAVCDLQGTRVLLAILAYQAEKGEPPASLSDLLPGILPEVPGDPWFKSGFLYRRLDPPSATGRRFVLYSVGLDGVDNGGVMSDDQGKWPFSQDGAGTDMVFSEGK